MKVSDKTKSYIFMVCSVLLPLIYTLIKNVNPDIPLTDSEFLELTLWIIGGAVGGWNGMKINVVTKLEKKNMTFKQLCGK